MKALTVKALVEMETDIGSLAEVLARSPDDFAKFWFCFAELVKKDEIDLEPFGEAMAPAFGAMRKHPFNAITDYMRYYERKSETP